MFFFIFMVIFLALHSLMNLEVLISAEIWVHLDNFVTKRAWKDFFGNFFMIGTLMWFYWVMITAENFDTVFALDREPIFLFTCINWAMLADVLIEHDNLENF